MMHKATLTMIVVSGGLILHPFPSWGADSHAQDRRTISEAISKMDAAFEKRDADSYVAFTDPDFVNIDKDGRETTHGKQERRAKNARLFTHLTSATEHTTVNGIVFSQDGATVTETSDGSYSLLVNGQSQKVKSHSTYRDFWVRSGSVWLQKRSRTVSSQRTVNGQPVP